MSKKTITFFVLTTILVIVGAIGYGFYLDGVISKNLSNPLSESANNSPYIPYIYVTSGLLSKSLTKNYSNGVIPKFTDAIPVDSYSFSQSLFDSYGHALVGFTSAEVESGKYQDFESRPFRIVGIFKTSIGKTPYMLLVEQWLDRDYTVKFVLLVVMQDSFGDFEYQNALGTRSLRFYSPITQIKDVEACLSIPPAGEAYCRWFKNHQDSINSLGRLWIEKNIIPTQIANYPLIATLPIVTTSIK